MDGRALAGLALLFGHRRGFAFAKVQEYISFAGDSRRPDVNFLLVTPTLLWHFSAVALSRKSRVLVREKSSTDLSRSDGLGTKRGATRLKLSLVWSH